METIISHGIGKCKQAIAHVLITRGNGKIIINNKDGNLYLQNNLTSLKKINNTFRLLYQKNIYDTFIKMCGGGLRGQSNAAVLAISRALVKLNKDNRCILKYYGLLTRDSRVIERKKYGLKKARKASQYSKR